MKFDLWTLAAILGSLLITVLIFGIWFMVNPATETTPEEIISREPIAPIAVPTKDPALYICDQFDALPLNKGERVKLDQHIKEQYGVECP